MGDPYSGRIYELAENEQAEPGHVPLTKEQADKMKMLDVEQRKRELQQLLAEQQTATATAPALAQGTTYAMDDFKRIELENRYSYHPPKGDQTTRYNIIRQQVLSLAQTICTLTPSSREQSTALTHLDAVMFNANAAIARGE